jgi:hypothetical protein
MSSQDPVRNYVLGMYPRSKDWAKQVSKMSKEQVFAIYKRDLEDKEQKKLEEETARLADDFPQGKLF